MKLYGQKPKPWSKSVAIMYGTFFRNIWHCAGVIVETSSSLESIWNLKLKLHSNLAEVDSNHSFENFPEWNFMSRNQNHGQNPLPSCMEHFSEIYGTVSWGKKGQDWLIFPKSIWSKQSHFTLFFTTLFYWTCHFDQRHFDHTPFWPSAIVT